MEKKGGGIAIDKNELERKSENIMRYACKIDRIP